MKGVSVLATLCAATLRLAALTPLFEENIALASPCCSGTSSLPSVMTGDDETQVSFSFSRSSIIGETSSQGKVVFRAARDHETTETFSLDAAHLLSDRWQAGAGLSVSRRQIDRFDLQNASHIGLGDLRGSIAYEALPQYSWSSWKPKVYVFSALTIPTGRSVFEAQERLAVDVHGKGIYQFELGALATKQGSFWDGFFSPSLRFAPSRSFQSIDGTTLDVGSHWGAEATLGAGVSPGGGNLRFGARLNPVYRAQRRIRSDATDTLSSYQLTWNIGLEAAYLMASTWSLSASYVDQTLLGPAINSSLTRSLSLTLQKRWER